MESWAEFDWEIEVIASGGEEEGVPFVFSGGTIQGSVSLTFSEPANLAHATVELGYLAYGSGSPETHTVGRTTVIKGRVVQSQSTSAEFAWRLNDMAPISYEGTYVKLSWFVTLILTGEMGEIEKREVPILVRPRPMIEAHELESVAELVVVSAHSEEPPEEVPESPSSESEPAISVADQAGDALSGYDDDDDDDDDASEEPGEPDDEAPTDAPESATKNESPEAPADESTTDAKESP